MSTHGAGAVAMVVSADPALIAFDPESGSYTENVSDFWRPNYLDEALVDGKYSINMYLRALTESWQEYRKESGRDFSDFARFCYHLPFTRMAEKAHRHLAGLAGCADLETATLDGHLQDSLRYNRVIGNTYTASLYIGLTSMLENSDADLAGQRLGFFSYGSGCMAAFFSGIVMPNYRDHLHAEHHRQMLDNRIALVYQQYELLYTHVFPENGDRYETLMHETGGFRLVGMEDHKRLYEAMSGGCRWNRRGRMPIPFQPWT